MGFGMDVKCPNDTAPVHSYGVGCLARSFPFTRGFKEIKEKALVGAADGPGIAKFSDKQKSDKRHEVNPHPGKYDPCRLQ